MRPRRDDPGRVQARILALLRRHTELPKSYLNVGYPTGPGWHAAALDALEAAGAIERLERVEPIRFGSSMSRSFTYYRMRGHG